MALEKLDVYMPILILVAFAILLVVGALLVGKVLRPNKPNDRKKQAYECGEDPIGNAWSLFNMRFYVVGLIFIIFDVESALMFPVVAVALNAPPTVEAAKFKPLSLTTVASPVPLPSLPPQGT